MPPFTPYVFSLKNITARIVQYRKRENYKEIVGYGWNVNFDVWEVKKYIIGYGNCFVFMMFRFEIWCFRVTTVKLKYFAILRLSSSQDQQGCESPGDGRRVTGVIAVRRLECSYWEPDGGGFLINHRVIQETTVTWGAVHWSLKLVLQGAWKIEWRVILFSFFLLFLFLKSFIIPKYFLLYKNITGIAIMEGCCSHFVGNTILYKIKLYIAVLNLYGKGLLLLSIVHGMKSGRNHSDRENSRS